VKPQGYENISAEQAKVSGLFPLPGAPRQGAMDPTKLAALAAKPEAHIPIATPLKATHARQSRRLHVSGFPNTVSEEMLAAFFNDLMNGLNISTSGKEPVLGAQLNDDKTYAFLEFRTPEEATVGMAFDGTDFEGSTLKLRRPKDYIVPASSDEKHVPGVVATTVPDSINKIYIGNVPLYLNEEQILELIAAFGELKSFHLVKDTATEESKGFAFCEYVDPANTDIAIQGLHGMELAEQNLVVHKASIGTLQKDLEGQGVEAVKALVVENGTTSSRILQLHNMVTPEDLVDNEDYDDICEDIREECQKFGKVIDVKVPRPAGSQNNPGIGRVFVRFENEQGCTKALKGLAGRRFCDRTVLTSYFAEENYDVNAW